MDISAANKTHSDITRRVGGATRLDSIGVRSDYSSRGGRALLSPLAMGRVRAGGWSNSLRRYYSATRGAFLLAALAVSLAVACGSAAAVSSTQPSAGVDPAAPSGDLKAILATTVLDVGTQRVAFLLTSPKALIKVPEVEVTTVFLGDGDAVGETKRAGFNIWPYGVRGSYVTEMTFDRPGPWRLDILVDLEGVELQAHASVDVAQQGSVPSLGAIPPLSQNKTLQSVGSLEKLTTDFSPDPDLYQLTVADAVASGQPTVVVFASPAFCTSPTCGPQTDTLSKLKSAHQGQANFIHVEIYDNPDEIQGDLSRGTLSQPVHDWGISGMPGWFNESWTFVLGRDGRISQRFEGFATLEELEEALQAVLAQG